MEVYDRINAVEVLYKMRNQKGIEKGSFRWITGRE